MIIKNSNLTNKEENKKIENIEHILKLILKNQLKINEYFKFDSPKWPCLADPDQNLSIIIEDIANLEASIENLHTSVEYLTTLSDS